MWIVGGGRESSLGSPVVMQVRAQWPGLGAGRFVLVRRQPLRLEFTRFPAFPRRRQWHPTPVLLPGKSHGQRSLVGCRLWGHTELDTTERIHFHFHFSLSCIGEGNGNPLQCSCLENPRDGGAWWAVVYGVAQSRTRLKRLSGGGGGGSSSSSRSSASISKGLRTVR